MDAIAPEAITVAVGLVPGRVDGMASLHVGGSYILLTPDELRKLARDMIALSGPMTEGAAVHKRTWSVPVFHQDIP